MRKKKKKKEKATSDITHKNLIQSRRISNFLVLADRGPYEQGWTSIRALMERHRDCLTARYRRIRNCKCEGRKDGRHHVDIEVDSRRDNGNSSSSSSILIRLAEEEDSCIFTYEHSPPYASTNILISSQALCLEPNPRTLGDSSQSTRT